MGDNISLIQADTLYPCSPSPGNTNIGDPCLQGAQGQVEERDLLSWSRGKLPGTEVCILCSRITPEEGGVYAPWVSGRLSNLGLEECLH